MSNIMNIDSVQQYNDYFGIDTLHPLVTVIEGCKGKPIHFCKKLYNIYAILIKDPPSARISFAASVSTCFCRYLLSGLAPYTGS